MKDNSECSTLRIGSLPKSELVKDAKEVKGATLVCAKQQTNNPPDDTRRTRGNSGSR